MLANPLLSADNSDVGGLFFPTDPGSSPAIQGIVRSPMNDAAITGQVAGVQAGGTANVSVAVLVLIALGGLFAFHLLGFRFAGDVSVGRK